VGTIQYCVQRDPIRLAWRFPTTHLCSFVKSPPSHSGLDSSLDLSNLGVLFDTSRPIPAFGRLARGRNVCRGQFRIPDSVVLSPLGTKIRFLDLSANLFHGSRANCPCLGSSTLALTCSEGITLILRRLASSDSYCFSYCMGAERFFIASIMAIRLAVESVNSR
jgi:hypothetical protein